MTDDGVTGGVTDDGVLRFGTSLRGWTTGAELVAAARGAEAQGFDVVSAADHLGAPAPFSVLATVAAVTDRVALRTYVLDAYFWNPALLAREVATLDALSAGRVVLGVGAGHMRDEHDDAGLPFPGITRRWADTEALVVEVRRRLDDPDHAPAPMQRPVPVMVAGMGERALSVAARRADVVGLAGLAQVPGQRPGTFTVTDSATTDERLARLRQEASAAGRSPSLDALLQRVVLAPDPETAARRVADEAAAEGMTWLVPELLLDCPFMLFAESAAHAADELRRRTRRWGITTWSTHAPSRDALAEVLAAVRR